MAAFDSKQTNHSCFCTCILPLRSRFAYPCLRLLPATVFSFRMPRDSACNLNCVKLCKNYKLFTHIVWTALSFAFESWLKVRVSSFAHTDLQCGFNESVPVVRFWSLLMDIIVCLWLAGGAAAQRWWPETADGYWGEQEGETKTRRGGCFCFVLMNIDKLHWIICFTWVCVCLHE